MFGLLSLHLRRHISSSLNSITDIWMSAGDLSGSNKLYALSFILVVFWIRWNDHNGTIFLQRAHDTMYAHLFGLFFRSSI
jgi:hypothetical protein